MKPLALVRAAYGGALLLAPGQVLRLYGGPPANGTALAAARVLGGRHLLQAVMTKAGRFSRLGSVVDALHAASMFAFAAARPDYRRPALIDGCVATAFAGAGGRGAGER